MGAHGVELFFVISGFCLSYPFLSGEKFEWRRFAAKRAWRIIPAYYVAVVLLSYFVPWAGVVPDGASIEARDILVQLSFWDSPHSFVPFMWTLCVEMRWYFVFPLLLWAFGRSKILFLALLGGCYVLYTTTGLTGPDLLALPVFMAGIFAAYAHIHKLRIAVPAALCALAILPLAFLHSEHQGNPANAIFFTAITIVACNLRALQWALSWPPLVFVGTASYSIYLIHDPIVAWTMNAGFPAPLGAAAGVAAGIAFWYCVERTITRGAVLATWHAFTTNSRPIVAEPV